MDSLLRMTFTVVKTKISSLLARIRRWTEPEFIRSVTLAKPQESFRSLFDVESRDKDDYYVFFSWMTGRKLAFSLVLPLGLESLFLITMFHPFQGIGSGAVRTYRYDSPPLKFHKGKTRILAKDGHTAYVGNVKKGNAAGTGELYGKSGEPIYEGVLESSLCNGEGKSHYGNGVLKYSGEFKDNVCQGMGNGYWSNSSKEYSGDCEQGKRSGEGQPYDSGGNLVLTGLFSAGLPVHVQFLGKPTEEAGQIHSGKLSVYDSGDKFCVNMPQINAIYTVRDGGDFLRDTYAVNWVRVLSDNIALTGKTYDEVSTLEGVMGEVGYQRYFDMELTGAAGITTLRKRGNPGFADPQLEGSRAFQKVMKVNGYRTNYDLYLYTFIYEDLVYSFYSDKKNGRFAMYSIKHAVGQK